MPANSRWSKVGKITHDGERQVEHHLSLDRESWGGGGLGFKLEEKKMSFCGFCL